MPISEAAPRRFDIVVVPFPYSDQLAEKRRPALIVSSDDFNERTGLLWVLMITSAVNPGRDGDVAIPEDRESGLSASSLVRTTKIATIEPHRVQRVAGRIDKKLAQEVARQLSNTLS